NGVTVLSDFFDLGVETPGRIVRNAVAVQVAGGTAAGRGRIPPEGAKIREAILFALHARGDRYREVIIDVFDKAAAAAIANRVVARQILPFIVVGWPGAKAEFRALVIKRRD